MHAHAICCSMNKKQRTPSLQVREVSAEVYGTLLDRAKKEHRSLAQQTLATLERGLGIEEDRTQRRLGIIEAIRETDVADADQLPDPVTVVREDRER